MKNDRRRKLELNRETIKALSAAHLRDAAGGTTLCVNDTGLCGIVLDSRKITCARGCNTEGCQSLGCYTGIPGFC